MDLQKVGCGGMDGLSWLRIGTGSGHWWMQYWTYRFHKMWGISWQASQEGLCSME